jgi:hypothetical protein
MKVEIRNLPEVQQLLRNLSDRELKYATVVGTNRIAYAVMQAQREEVKTTFVDKPPVVLYDFGENKTADAGTEYLLTPHSNGIVLFSHTPA